MRRDRPTQIKFANAYLGKEAGGFKQREPLVVPAKACGVDIVFVPYHACAPSKSHEIERPHDFGLLVEIAKRLREQKKPAILLSDTNIDTKEPFIKYWSPADGSKAKKVADYFVELTGEKKLPLQAQRTSLKRSSEISRRSAITITRAPSIRSCA